jgi:hypothetical protein
MAVAKHEIDTIALRRARVSSLRARGLTHEEIYHQLAAQFINGNPNPSYMVNTETHEPFDRSTITRDLKWLRDENIKCALASAEEHRANQLAEVRELKRAAWAGKRYETVLACLAREAKLLGLDMPERHDLTSGGDQITTVNFIAIPSMNGDLHTNGQGA